MANAYNFFFNIAGRLKDREKSIDSVKGLSEEFSSVTRELADWLGDVSDRVDGLPKISSQPDKQQAQREEMQVSEKMQSRQKSFLIWRFDVPLIFLYFVQRPFSKKNVVCVVNQ